MHIGYILPFCSNILRISGSIFVQTLCDFFEGIPGWHIADTKWKSLHLKYKILSFLEILIKFCYPGWGPDPNWFLIRPSQAHTRVFPDHNYRVWTEIRVHYSLDDGLEMVWS